MSHRVARARARSNTVAAAFGFGVSLFHMYMTKHTEKNPHRNYLLEQYCDALTRWEFTVCPGRIDECIFRRSMCIANWHTQPAHAVGQCMRQSWLLTTRCVTRRARARAPNFGVTPCAWRFGCLSGARECTVKQTSPESVRMAAARRRAAESVRFQFAIIFSWNLSVCGFRRWCCRSVFQSARQFMDGWLNVGCTLGYQMSGFHETSTLFGFGFDVWFSGHWKLQFALRSLVANASKVLKMMLKIHFRHDIANMDNDTNIRRRI